MKTFFFCLVSRLLSATAAHGAETVQSEQEHQNFIHDRTEATPQQMAGIWYSLKAVKTEAERVSVLEYVPSDTGCATVQVRALVEMIASETARADTRRALYPRLTNPDRFESLLTLLPDSNVRQSTLSRVGLQVTASL